MCTKQDIQRLQHVYLEQLPIEYSVRKVIWLLDGRKIQAIEKATMPPDMRATWSQLGYAFKASRRVALLLFHQGRPIGYVLGLPMDSPRSLYDPNLDPPDGYGEDNTLYLQSIGIVPEFQGAGGLQYLVAEFIRRGHQKGYRNCTAHMRHSNGVSLYARRKFGFEQLAVFQNWQDTGERFDYMILRNPKKPVCPPMLYTYLNFRRLLKRLQLRLLPRIRIKARGVKTRIT